MIVDVRCPVCGHTSEVNYGVDALSFCRGPVDARHVEAMMVRVWSAPAIGRVSGAGGSPSR